MRDRESKLGFATYLGFGYTVLPLRLRFFPETLFSKFREPDFTKIQGQSQTEGRPKETTARYSIMRLMHDCLHWHATNVLYGRWVPETQVKKVLRNHNLANIELELALANLTPDIMFYMDSTDPPTLWILDIKISENMKKNKDGYSRLKKAIMQEAKELELLLQVKSGTFGYDPVSDAIVLPPLDFGVDLQLANMAPALRSLNSERRYWDRENNTAPHERLPFLVTFVFVCLACGWLPVWSPV